MTRELRHGVARRLLPVVAVLLGLFFMHGLSGSVFGAAAHHASGGADAPSMGELTTTVLWSGAGEPPADAAAVPAVGEVVALGAWAVGQADDGKHSGRGLMGLCLAFLTVILFVLAAACHRPRAVLGGGTWWSVRLRPLPVRCRAPDLFALGVLRC